MPSTVQPVTERSADPFLDAFLRMLYQQHLMVTTHAVVTMVSFLKSLQSILLHVILAGIIPHHCTHTPHMITGSLAHISQMTKNLQIHQQFCGRNKLFVFGLR